MSPIIGLSTVSPLFSQNAFLPIEEPEVARGNDSTLSVQLYAAANYLNTLNQGRVSQTIGQSKEVVNIDGVDYFKNTVKRHDNGKIALGQLTKPQTVDDTDITYSGLISFHPNGQVHVGVLTKQEEVDDIKYKAGDISFHANGKVFEGTLAKQKNVDGIEFAKNKIIALGPDGKVILGTLAKKIEIDGITYLPGVTISLDRDGKVLVVSDSDSEDILAEHLGLLEEN